MPLISVIIPSYNRAPQLDATLASLACQTRNDFLTILVDHGSTDDTEEIYQKHKGMLPLAYYKIARDARHFAGVPRDFGVRKAETPLILFIDAGMVVPSWFIDAHIAFHRLYPGRVGIGLQHGYQGLESFQPDDAVEKVSEGQAASLFDQIDIDSAYEILKQKHLQDHREGMDLATSHIPWFFGWTANLSLSKTAYHAAGGFDLELEGWGFEDSDLCYRLFKQGVAFAFVKDGWGIELPQPRNSFNERYQSNFTNMMHCYTKQRSIALETLLLTYRFIVCGTSEAVKASYAQPAKKEGQEHVSLEAMLEQIHLRFNQYAEKIYAYLATIKQDAPAQISLPADFHTHLNGPTLLIGGHPQDAAQYDYVTIGDESFPSTASVWSCWGTYIPLPDQSLGTVVVSDIWEKLYWSPQSSFGRPGVSILETLITEIQRTAKKAIFLHSSSVSVQQESLVKLLEQICQKYELDFQILVPARA